MPPKLTADQNSLFLYTIIKTADLKSIQWNQVGKQFNLTNQAAYMRFSRLRSVMEKELDNLDAKMAANPLTPSKKSDNSNSNNSNKPSRSPIKKTPSKAKAKKAVGIMPALPSSPTIATHTTTTITSNPFVTGNIGGQHHGISGGCGGGSGVIGMPTAASFDSTVSTLDLYKDDDYKEDDEIMSSSPTKKRRLNSEDIDILSEGSYGVYTD